MTAVWAQVRQESCESCHQPFYFLAQGKHEGTATGVPLFSADASMREDVAGQIQQAFEKVARQPECGLAPCPHCGKYQGWMAFKDGLKRFGWATLIGGILGAVIGMIFSSLFFFAGVMVVAWLIANHVRAKNSDQTQQIERLDVPYCASMTESEFAAYLLDCDAADRDPTLLWYLAQGGEFDEKVPVIPLEFFLQSEAA